jgi:hypothetical protein
MLRKAQVSRYSIRPVSQLPAGDRLDRGSRSASPPYLHVFRNSIEMPCSFSQRSQAANQNGQSQTRCELRPSRPYRE